MSGKIYEETYVCSVRLPGRILRRLDKDKRSRSEVIREILEKHYEFDTVKLTNLTQRKVWTFKCPTCKVDINFIDSPVFGDIYTCKSCGVKITIRT